MVRDKKTIKFNPLDKISPSNVDHTKASVKKPPAVNSSVKSDAVAPKVKVTRSVPKTVNKTVNAAGSEAVAALKTHESDQLTPLNESSCTDIDRQYQALDAQVGYSSGPSRGWDDAQLHYSPQTRNFGFFDVNGSFVDFSAENLKSQMHAGSILPKALIGLVFGGGVGFALGYLLAKNPERYIYFQLQNEDRSILYLRLNSRALGYII